MIPRIRIIPLIVFAFLFPIILGCSIAGTAGPKTYNQGDRVQFGNLVVSILGWEELKPNIYVKPKEGNKFIGVTILAVNANDLTQDISSVDWLLKDSTNQKYSATSGTVQDLCFATSMRGVLIPGERLLGCVEFEIPTNLTGLVLVGEGFPSTEEKLFFNIHNKPGLLAIPAAGTITGERQIPVVAMNTPGTIGAFRITINSISNTPADNPFMPEDYSSLFVYLTVDVTIENISSASESITEYYTYVKDRFGYRHEFNFIKPSTINFTNGELSAGERVRGQIGYDVPKDMEGLLFVFDDSGDHNGKLFFSII
jgi:hypothetical protein